MNELDSARAGADTALHDAIAQITKTLLSALILADGPQLHDEACARARSGIALALHAHRVVVEALEASQAIKVGSGG